MSNDVAYNYFDHSRSWDHTNEGWHEIIIERSSPFKHLDMVRWLYDNIDKPERHARWIRFSDASGFKFRYERDYILFTLRWG